MISYDNTHISLIQYLTKTEQMLNELLSKRFSGSARIKTLPDLGFPHDVIRIAGGFATGAYVDWNSEKPFVPVDTCVNVCSVSCFEINNDIRTLFNSEHLDTIKSHLHSGIYLSNFHRGNHFMSYLKSIKTQKRYLLLHSSANEFKDNFNGLYPIKGNWYFDKIKTYSNNNSYIRYLDGKDAEMFYSIASDLYRFNETRHEFIAHVLLKDFAAINKVSHFHHYGMPNNFSIIMGGHIMKNNEIAPLLTVPGENVYFIKYNYPKDDTLKINDSLFLTPHGWGKTHIGTPSISLKVPENKFILDEESYEIEFGTSLRNHKNLKLRDFSSLNSANNDNFFKYLTELYDFEIIDEMEQISSWSKEGVKWHVN